jgi:hypothetical protein
LDGATGPQGIQGLKGDTGAAGADGESFGLVSGGLSNTDYTGTTIISGGDSLTP